MQQLAGKAAIVTGAASGIGLGIATALGQSGVKVMMSDIDAGGLEAEVAKRRGRCPLCPDQDRVRPGSTGSATACPAAESGKPQSR